MKKTVVFLVLLFCLLGAATVFGVGNPIDIVVDGKLVSTDVPPQMSDGRVLVPIRAVSEALGAEVTWDPVNYRVVITSKKETPVNTDKDLGQKQVYNYSSIITNGDLSATIESVEVYPLANITNIYVSITKQENSAQSATLLRDTIFLQQEGWACQYTGNKTGLNIKPGEKNNFILRFEGFNTSKESALLKFQIEESTMGIKTFQTTLDLSKVR